eukprot:2482232-Pyramimonas_sp.AAC.1
MDLTVGIWGPLPGPRQTVARGELYSLWVALRENKGYIVYVTDNSSIFDGWHSQRWKQPVGSDADLWWRVGELMRT